MVDSLNSILKSHSPIVLEEVSQQVKPLISVVDAIADELVAEYSNPDYRRWYCGVINRYGLAKVDEWRRRASEGKEPAKLFSLYVKQAQYLRANKQLRS